MGLFEFSERVNRYLHRKEVGKLTRDERRMANAWTLRLIRERHPGWSDKQVRDYFQNLIHIKVRAVKEWELRMGLELPFDESPSPEPKSPKKSK